MIRQNFHRIDPKRRTVFDHRKKPFADPSYKELQYPYRLNFYSTPPTAEITLEEFEQWAIDRLRVLAELEACSFRNKTLAETVTHMQPFFEKHLPLKANSSLSTQLAAQRKKDHYSHFILRLAFAQTEDLRRRFARVETALFRLRFQDDDASERNSFVKSFDFDWEAITEKERSEFAQELADMAAASYGGGATGRKLAAQKAGDEAWCKVDWDRVPELVEGRRVLVRGGKAYVPSKEQQSMVVAEFTKRLERALELTARALPRLDEDDRLTPILDHLSKSFITPDAEYTSNSAVDGAEITARSIEKLAQHFPMCMSHLHRSLRRDAHLKHYGRLQYSLFLKGIGLSLEEALIFWRQAFHKITDDTFNKEYKYYVRHSYGDAGGDSNRRSGGYSPFSCQKILTEHPPGPGEAHGCPYRHFSPENLTALLQASGVRDGTVLRGVIEDNKSQKYHMACNRVFDYMHKNEIRQAKDESFMTTAQLETIVHPNEYFKRSYLLKHMKNGGDAKMEG